MSILSVLFTLLTLAFVLFISGVGIAFFGEWAYLILQDMMHHHA